MAHRAVAIHRAAVAIMAHDNTLTINGRAAGATVVGVAAVGGTVVISCLTGGRSEDGKAGNDGQKGDEFHSGWRFSFDLLPQHGGVFLRRGSHTAIQQRHKNFILMSTEDHTSEHKSRGCCLRRRKEFKSSGSSSIDGRP